MNYQEIVADLIKYGKIASEKNLSPGYSGNMSARYGDNVIITKSGTSNGFLCEDDFVVIDFGGNVISGCGKASSEKFLHLEFYKMRPDINYIIHVHPPVLTAFAACGRDLSSPLLAESIYYFGSIPLAEYALAGSWELVEKTAKYFENFSEVLMANHGIIIGSSTLHDAYMKLEMAECCAQTILNCEILGGARNLTKQQIDEIMALKG